MSQRELQTYDSALVVGGSSQSNFRRVNEQARNGVAKAFVRRAARVKQWNIRMVVKIARQSADKNGRVDI